MNQLIIHSGAIMGWNHFDNENEFIIYQINYPDGDISFLSFYTDEGQPVSKPIAIFRVKRRLTNMMIAEQIINSAFKTQPI